VSHLDHHLLDCFCKQLNNLPALLSARPPARLVTRLTGAVTAAGQGHHLLQMLLLRAVPAGMLTTRAALLQQLAAEPSLVDPAVLMAEA